MNYQTKLRPMTSWRNPLSVAQRIDVFNSRNEPEHYTFAPKEETEVPSEYDRAIHRVIGGKVCGGLAPLLIRAGQDYKVHEALVQRPIAPNSASVGVDPAELEARLAGDGTEEDPVIAAARRRRNK